MDGRCAETETKMAELISIIDFYSFINSETGDKSLINELGKEIEKASIGDLKKAGENLEKALKKNPVWSEVKKSFDKATKEYHETNREFRLNELNRKGKFDKEQSLFKVEEHYRETKAERIAPA